MDYVQSLLPRKLASLKQRSAKCERARSAIASMRDSALAEQKKAAERSEDVENSASFLLFLVSFFLLWLASKEEKKYKSKKYQLLNTSKYIFCKEKDEHD